MSHKFEIQLLKRIEYLEAALERAARRLDEAEFHVAAKDARVAICARHINQSSADAE